MPFKKAFALSAAINLFFLLLCIFFGNLEYGVRDDYFMAAILTGALGDNYNPHMYFVNALYGYVLIPLYHLFPKVGWYYLGEMFGVFVSFTTITYILIQKIGRYWGSILATILLAFFYSDFYLSVQFTQCAALYSAAGAISILWGISEKKKLPIILGSVLLFWGSIIRWDAFMMGGPFIALGILMQWKSCLQNWKVLLITCCVLSLAIYSARQFDRSLYNTSEYTTYKNFQGPRATGGDGNNYNTEAVTKELKAMGKSVEDFQMLRTWKFYDTETFNVDSLRLIERIIGKHTYQPASQNIPSSLYNAIVNSTSYYRCWAFFIISILVLLTNPRRGLYPWAAFAIILCEMAYLLHLNRLVLRVENGVWVYATLLAIPSLGAFRTFPKKFYTTAILSILAICFGLQLKTYVNSSDERIQKEKNDKIYQEVLKYIDDNPSTLFLISMPQYAAISLHREPPYMATPIGAFKRIVCFGFWTPYLPEVTKTLQEFNVTNPLKEVVNDNVVVIGDPSLKDFLERHYFQNVQVTKVKQFGQVSFYKYSIDTKK